MNDDPRMMRLYAAIFEDPQRDPVSGKFLIPSAACMAAARALRFTADALERLTEY